MSKKEGLIQLDIGQHVAPDLVAGVRTLRAYTVSNVRTPPRVAVDMRSGISIEILCATDAEAVARADALAKLINETIGKGDGA